MAKTGLCVGRIVVMNKAIPLIDAVPYYPFNNQPIIPDSIPIDNNKKSLFMDIESIEKGLSNRELEGKEKEIIIKARVNQSTFRQQLLDRYKKCCLCSVNNPSLLIASHIKPWSESKAHEKLDVENGFLLCPNHDKLFDSALISFDSNGKIIISDKLTAEDRCALGINENMKINITETNKKYLTYHRDKLK